VNRRKSREGAEKRSESENIFLQIEIFVLKAALEIIEQLACMIYALISVFCSVICFLWVMIAEAGLFLLFRRFSLSRSVAHVEHLRGVMMQSLAATYWSVL
jgi:hypothetical protein